MHFNGAFSSEGSGARIVIYSLVGKVRHFSFIIIFACTKNTTEFEALLLVLVKATNLGCRHLTIFRDFELIINLIQIIHTLAHKLLKCYTQLVEG
jgi:ribonuclease HI